MLRKRWKGIVLVVIVAELVLVGVLFLLREPQMLGLTASTKGNVSGQGVSVDQNPISPAPSATFAATVAKPASTPLALVPITIVPPTPVTAPDSAASPAPTLPPINVVPPAPTSQSLPVVGPIIPANPGAQSSSLPDGSRVVIKAIGVDSPIVEMGYTLREENGQEVADWHVPQFAVGHMIGSANPGARGNVVLSAHNNIYGSLFKKLYTLKVGDEVTIFNTAGAGFVYRVSQAFIVQELGAALEQRLANARVLLPTQDARITLISCWPETDNSDRAIVIAELVGSVQ